MNSTLTLLLTGNRQTKEGITRHLDRDKNEVINELITHGPSMIDGTNTQYGLCQYTYRDNPFYWVFNQANSELTIWREWPRDARQKIPTKWMWWAAKHKAMV